ncbi:MAG: hypothetical protein HZA48_04675 [Planctomycetes bacterium]|nr:hypothetical protein [Planctomycetota bacterium]
MNKDLKICCPPFTTEDILCVRGKPMAKEVRTASNRNSARHEEWIYSHVSGNMKERYIFTDGYLVGWQKTEL